MIAPLAWIALTLLLCVAVGFSAWLMKQRERLKLELSSAEAVNDHLSDIIADQRFREEKLNQHCLKIIAERNQCRNALLHASEELSRERLLRACAGKGFFEGRWGSA